MADYVMQREVNTTAWPANDFGAVHVGPQIASGVEGQDTEADGAGNGAKRKHDDLLDEDGGDQVAGDASFERLPKIAPTASL